MSNEITITTERVDDLPILLAQMEKMSLAETLDAHFPMHGKWQGLSLGKVTSVWLSYILQEGDHRLSYLEDWIEPRQHTLQGNLGEPIRLEDFTDDRLERVLEALGDDSAWNAFEKALNPRLLRVYHLESSLIRLDSTSASGYWEVTSEGLFQFGHSKDHRPDLPQVKVMLATLDPLGLPLVSQVVSGEKADDPLYVPAIAAVRQSVVQPGLLYVGDCKMAAVNTRAYLQAGKDYYLMPFPKEARWNETLDTYLEAVWNGTQTLTSIERPQAEEAPEREAEDPEPKKSKVMAQGFEREVEVTQEFDGKTYTWKERHLVIRSLHLAQAAIAGLRERLAHAEAALLNLSVRKQGKTCFTELQSLQTAAEAVVQRYQVTGLLHLQYQEVRQTRHVQRYRERPAEDRVEVSYQLQVTRDIQAITQTEQTLGWRIYATNQAAEKLSLTQAVWAYREEYLIERGFGRLKGRSLALSPMYLQTDARATGLIRLLTLGLRILTLLEGVARQKLATQGARLAGLYPGNPKRTTARPTTEMMLRAFKPIDLTIVRQGTTVQIHIKPLSKLQLQILDLWELPPDIYTRLAANFSNPPQI